MINKRGLQTQQATATTGDAVFGTAVPSNTRRYIYKIKTVNTYAGANQLEIGYSHDDGETHDTLDYINHATEHEMWNDPDNLTEDSLPIYIIPYHADGNKLYLTTNNGDSVEVYIEYEDSE